MSNERNFVSGEQNSMKGQEDTGSDKTDSISVAKNSIPDETDAKPRDKDSTPADRMWIRNAGLVLPDTLLTGSVYVENGKIRRIVAEYCPGNDFAADDCRVVDAEGLLLLPGLVDIHSDAIEKEVQPRPNTLFPLEMALYELEKKLAGNGITTMFHSLSLGVGLSLRGDELMLQMIRLIRAYRQRKAMIRHRIHLRYEVTHFPGLPIAEQLIDEGAVDYLSFMNHAPGQGQYRRPGSFEAYVMKNQGVDREEVAEIVDNVLRKQKDIDWDRLRVLAERARKRGIAVASHDDDTREIVDAGIRMGVSVSEFPLNLDTARYAKQRGLSVCVGAPNVVRGGSHDNNLRAGDAIAAGVADVLCSDYYPSALLAAVFKAAEQIGLPRAAAMASLNPASAVGIADRIGSIEEGKQADLILVQVADDYPIVRKTWVEGKLVHTADYYRDEQAG